MDEEPRRPSEEVQNPGEREWRSHPPFFNVVLCLQQSLLLRGGGVPWVPRIPGLMGCLDHP
eukprot:12892852-Alexandrium_andersonii.AAC.1